jgi:1-(5-phosphoribosyl)-5-[(5-phosphoribosylamino)methylideneamino] imidazole-4-carboxamide isomerase (EC 5.3.1.16)
MTLKEFIIPAIDIKDGKVVRLYKGEFDKVKVYNENPVDMAKYFEDAGIKHIHVVDLDGALEGLPKNIKI